MLRIVSLATLAVLMGMSAAQAGDAAPTLKVSVVIESVCTMTTIDAKTYRVNCSIPTAYRVEVTNEPVAQVASASGTVASGTVEHIASVTERVATVVF